MSGSRSGFSIQITAVDQATKQIDQINRHIAAMRAPAERLTKSFSKLADNTGITALGAGMRKVSQEAGSAFQNIGRIVAPLSAITGAASLAGLGTLATRLGDFGNKTQIAASRAGVGSVQLLNLGNAARLAGSSSEAMTGALTSLKDNIFEIAAGRGAPMTIAAFQKLGVATQDASGALRPATDVMADLATALANVKDPTMRANLELLTLGGTGADLDPLLRLGAKGMARLTEEGKKLYGVTDEQIKASVEFHQKTEALTIATEGLGIAIGADLLPVLGPVLMQMTAWITANKDWIAQDIAGFISKVVPQIEAFAKGADEVAQSLGGWKTVLEGVVAIKLGTWALGAISSLTPLIRLLALIPGSGVTAGVLAAAGLTYLGSKAETPENRETIEQNRRDRGAGLVPQVNDGFGPDGQPLPPTPAPAEATRDLLGKLANSQLGKLLAKGEAGAAGYNAVNRGAAGGYASGMENLANMTVAEVQAAQKAHKFNAAGRYQIIGPTLDSAVEGLGLTGKEKFDPATQDRIFEQYLVGSKRKEIGDYISGKSNDLRAAVSGMSKEWASVADPATGKSHYGGVGNNKASISVEQATLALKDARLHVASGSGDGVEAVMARLRGSGPPANIQGGTGTAPPADSTTTVKGSANVNIKLGGFPPGTRTVASADGGLFSGPPRVEQAMAATGGP